MGTCPLDTQPQVPEAREKSYFVFVFFGDDFFGGVIIIYLLIHILFYISKPRRPVLAVQEECLSGSWSDSPPKKLGTVMTGLALATECYMPSHRGAPVPWWTPARNWT